MRGSYTFILHLMYNQTRSQSYQLDCLLIHLLAVFPYLMSLYFYLLLLSFNVSCCYDDLIYRKQTETVSLALYKVNMTCFHTSVFA